MNLFFSSLKFEPHSTTITPDTPSLETLISTVDPLFSMIVPDGSARLNQIIIGLLLENNKPISMTDMSEISLLAAAAGILEVFEYAWNSPSRTVKSATIATFKLLTMIFKNREIRTRISDDCLTDFFSSEEDLCICLDFSAVDEGGQPLTMSSAHKLYIKLAICFFDAALKSSWSLSRDAFIRTITVPNGESMVNKLAEILMMSGAAFQAYFYYKSQPISNMALLKQLQKNLQDIRTLLSRILGLLPIEIEEKYLKTLCANLIAEGELGCCYMILRTSRIIDLQSNILAHFFGETRSFEDLRRAYGDEKEPDLNESRALAEMTVPDALLLKAILVVVKGRVDEGKFDNVCRVLMTEVVGSGDSTIEFATRRKSEFTKRALLHQDESSGPALLKRMLYTFDKKNRTVNFDAFYKILEFIFPSIEDQVAFLVQPDFKDSSLANLINLRLVLVSVFDNTPYFTLRKPLTPRVFKETIKKNLLEILSFSDLFVINFHHLYYLSLKYTEVLPLCGIDELFKNLNLVLEVLREDRDTFAPIIKALLVKKDNYYPKGIDSYARIEHLVDADLYKADQDAEESRRQALVDSLIADDEKVAKKKKPKGMKGLSELPVAEKVYGAIAAAKPKIPVAAKPKIPVAAKPEISVATKPEISVAAKPKVSVAVKPKTPAAVKPKALATAAAAPPPSTSPPSASIVVRPSVEDDSRAVVSEPPILSLDHRNQSLLEYIEAFRLEVQFELDNVRMSEGAVNKLKSLEHTLCQRKQIIQSIHSYLKDAKSASDLLPCRIDRLTRENLFLPDRFQEKIQRLQKLVDDFIASVLQPVVDKAIDVHELINVISSVSVSLISPRELQSLHFLSIFKTNINALLGRFCPIFIRILSNESQYALQLREVSIDSKNLWQLIQQVHYWIDKIYLSPFDNHQFEDNLRFNIPAERMGYEALDSHNQLANEFNFIVRLWNTEVNQFAQALSATISKDPLTSLTPIMQGLYDKLSYSYFKDKYYPSIGLLRALFYDLAEVQIYGAQLTRNDCLDVDARLLWRNSLDSYDEIERKIREALIRVHGLAGAQGVSTEMRSLRDEHGEKIVFRVKALNGALDINVFKFAYFPWKAYVSHAAGCLDIRTGRMQYDHDFFESYIKNRLLIKIPAEPDSSPRITCSRNAHILKLLIRFCYSDDLIKPELCDLAKLMLQKFINFKSNLSGLKDAEPDLANALSLLINQHFEHDALTPAFFKRTEIIMRFCNDIGINLIVETKLKATHLISSNLASLQLLGVDGVAGDLRANGLVIRLKPELAIKVVSITLQAPLITGHAGFFGKADASGLASDESRLGQGPMALA